MLLRIMLGHHLIQCLLVSIAPSYHDLIAYPQLNHSSIPRAQERFIIYLDLAVEGNYS